MGHSSPWAHSNFSIFCGSATAINLKLWLSRKIQPPPILTRLRPPPMYYNRLTRDRDFQLLNSKVYVIKPGLFFVPDLSLWYEKIQIKTIVYLLFYLKFIISDYNFYNSTSFLDQIESRDVDMSS